MRHLTKFLLGLVVLLQPWTAAAQQPPLAFGVLNQQSPALTAERWNPILHYASTVSGVPLQLKMGRTVQETNSMMARGEFDFVFTNHNFQSEFDSLGFKVIARWAGEPIRAVIAVPADSPIQHLHQLEGKRVSFPSTDAFVAYAVPLVALKRAGVRVEQVFGGNQERTLAQLKARRVTLGGLAVDLSDRSTAARMRLSEQTERLGTAAAPLLLDALVVGDLARAEQMLRSLNGESVWSRVALYESDGRRLILDASPDNLKQSGAPRWVKHLVPVTLEEHRVAIAAPPVVYGVLAVTPSVQSLESDLWAEIRTMIAVTGVLLVTLLGLTHVILLVGLRPVRALAESAARLGSGDLTARMRETRLSEMAPTVRAFNSMAASLEQALHEARTREARLESLVAISGDLSRMQELDSLIGRIADACGRLVNTDWVGFRLVDGDELAMAGTLESSDLMVTPSLKIGSGLAGTVAASGRPLLVRDPADDPRMLPEDAKEVRRFGARGFLGVPAKLGDRVVGVLTFQTKREAGLAAEDMAIATAFASHAAIAVENRRLLLESRRAYDELAETQGQLEQVQKMDAIGRLAGGVAHDFNNLLTVILGRADILLRQLKPEDSMHRGIELIQRTAGRAADLTRQLLAFGRKQVLEPVVLDLSAVTMDMKDMLGRLIGEDIALLTTPIPGLGRVQADRGQSELA